MSIDLKKSNPNDVCARGKSKQKNTVFKIPTRSKDHKTSHNYTSIGLKKEITLMVSAQEKKK